MPRRKRIHIPNFLWHITHRCHKKEHLLKFEKDRKTGRDWLFKAKKTLWSPSDYLCCYMQPYPFAGCGQSQRAYFQKHGSLKRESIWTNNLAVGSLQYIEGNQHKFGDQYEIKALLAPFLQRLIWVRP